MTICILISSCKNIKYQDARLEQYKSLPDDIDIYYVQGQRQGISCELPKGDNVHLLEAPCGDNYEDITLKLWYGFKYLRNLYDIVIKTDENLIISDAKKLIDIVQEEAKIHPYGALKGIGGYEFPVLAIEHGHKVTHPLLKIAPAFFPAVKFAGSSYYLTSKALFLLNSKHFTTFVVEDYAIGFYLKTLAHISVHPSKAIIERIFQDRQDFDRPPLIPTIPIQGLDPYYEKIRNAIPDDSVCMISVHGGLGNQLFQIATGLEYCLMHNKRPIFATNPNNIRKYYWNSIFKRFNCLVQNCALDTVLYKEPHYHYKPIPGFHGNVQLWGYFQSVKYFPLMHSRLELSKLLDIEPVSTLTDNIVIVHARRGDYLSVADFHCVVNDQYYQDAVTEIEKRVQNPIYILLSDDQDYWMNSPIFKDRNASVWSDPDDENTFRFMLGSQNFILPNSTYSWWAAYLSKACNKNIIVPDKWFGPSGPQDYEDIYTDDMIKIHLI
jgi:hypothetical protein